MPARIDCDVDLLRHLYFDCGLNSKQVAVRAGLGSNRHYIVGRRLAEAGYRLRDAGKRGKAWPIEEMVRLYASEEMTTSEIAARYGCSVTHTRRLLRQAGATRRTGQSTKYRRGEHAPRWKGGKFVSPGGYVFVYLPKHPMAASNGYVAEHRLVASESLGICLTSRDEVHHVNGKKDDNRPENLMVISSGKHQKLHADLHKELWALRHEVAMLRGEIETGKAWRVVG